MELTLVVLAAGLSRRYGRLKQLDPLGPHGATLLDYAAYDASRAGFSKMVCVIRSELSDVFEQHVRAAYSHCLPIEFAVQRIDDAPARSEMHKPRDKPWGTGHAVLASERYVGGPFVAVNADDFYGAASYRLLADHFRDDRTEQIPVFALVGFRLAETLSPHGGVSRGICQTDTAGFLESLREVTQIVAGTDGTIRGVTADRVPVHLTGDEPASMSMWGFTPAVYPMLREEFARFVAERQDDPDAEFQTSTAVNRLLAGRRARFKVIPARDRWLGVTHAGDRPDAVARLRDLVTRGDYPERLFQGKEDTGTCS